MIVDVVDLNFETLNFSRSYDPRRYQRGKDIYNEEKVQVYNVDKDENDEVYYMQAKVRSRYEDYNTTLLINKNTITKFSCTCEDYFNGNLCKHIIATSMEAIEPHFASTKAGIKKIEKIREEQHQKYLKERQLKREYEQKYRYALNVIESFKDRKESVDISNNLDLQELYFNVNEEKSKKIGELATSVKLECFVEFYKKDTIKVSFKIGTTRMYILSDLGSFYRAYKQEREMYFGKQLRLIPKRENFNENSQKIFDYIMKFCEMIEYNNKFGIYDNNYSNKEIYISDENIEEFFKINNGKLIFKEYEGNKEYNLTDEKLDVKVLLNKENVVLSLYDEWYQRKEKKSEEYVFKLNIEDYNLVYSNKKIYIFYQNKIYQLEKDIKLLKLFDMFKNANEILIPEDKLNDFKRFVLPNIKCGENTICSENIAIEGEIVSNLASKIFLDIDDRNNILLKLKFCYNNYEFNVLNSSYKQYVKENNIVRDVPKETEIIKRIFIDGFELVSGRTEFIMKNEDDIYNFLSHKIEGYMNDFEVLATDKFKNKQIKQPRVSSIGVKLNNGLLELDISKINIDIKELKNVLKFYSIKKKYYKLKNGDFLDLSDNEDLNLLDEMTTTLDIDYGKIEKGIVNLPVNRSIYLEKILNDNKNINVSKNDEFVEIIDNINNQVTSKDIELDKNFEQKLRDYQKVGYSWLKCLQKYKFGGILADDMGLGKSLQIIAVLKNELDNNKNSTSIIVCPSTLVLNWKLEIEKWCNDIKVLIIKGNAEERKIVLEDYKKYNLVITSYDLLKRDIENYEGKFFKFIIADEAQYIKNSSTQNAISLKSLNGEIKYALTGTPIENSVAELWSIFDFIMPRYLYSYNKFKKKFEEPILKFEDKEILIRLKKLISPFILRRVKKDVLTELPEKNITIMKNEMEDEQEKIYLSYLAQTKKELADELQDNSFEKSKFKILMLLTRLRQICCHPSLFIDNYNGDSGKMKQCINLVKDAIEANHKILLFSSYKSVFEILEKEFDKLGIKYFKLIGDTPVNKRVEMVEEFNKNDDIKVFLISLKAGGTGLNLTSADVVIHYDPWWNVSSENQATDRAYRIGQKNSVQVYKLITNNSIEEKINKLQEKKEELSKNILSTEETFISKLSKEEILELFN